MLNAGLFLYRLHGGRPEVTVLLFGRGALNIWARFAGHGQGSWPLDLTGIVGASPLLVAAQWAFGRESDFGLDTVLAGAGISLSMLPLFPPFGISTRNEVGAA